MESYLRQYVRFYFFGRYQCQVKTALLGILSATFNLTWEMFLIQHKNVSILVKHIWNGFAALIIISSHSRSLFYETGEEWSSTRKRVRAWLCGFPVCPPSSANRNFVNGPISAVSRRAVHQKHFRTVSKPNCFSCEFLSSVLRFMTSAFHCCLRGSSPFFCGFQRNRNEEIFVFISARMRLKSPPSRLNKQTLPPCCGACCSEAVRTWKAVTIHKKCICQDA